MNGITILAERQIGVVGLNSAVLWITIPICAVIGICFAIWHGINEL